MVRTAEPGFEYAVYIGYDQGDAYFDVPGRENELQVWFATVVTKPMADKGLKIQLHFNKYNNVEKKPGPAFNSMMKKAYEDGVTWMYRLNDDTVMDTNWASALTGQLKAWGPPFGAAGPRCDQGNTAILTHDMTHRTHLDIFPTYYPPILSDWWMDDWISRVYGRRRTRRLMDVSVTHSFKHGTRYTVDWAHGSELQREIDKGRTLVISYMEAHTDQYPAEVITHFKNDINTFNVQHGRRR
jgi:hypothetical protein